jgi:hypothetical protein
MEKGIDIMAVSNNGDQLLVGSKQDNRIHSYKLKELKGLQRGQQTREQFYDAVITPNGELLYSTKKKNLCLMILGKTASKVKSGITGYFSVSNDDVIYIADPHSGVFKSSDDGKTWQLVFKLPDNSHQCIQAVKVSTNKQAEVFWVRESSTSNITLLRIYILNTQPTTDNKVTWRDVTLPTNVSIDVANSKLACDYSSGDVFVLDCRNKAVHRFSSSGQHIQQLTSIRFENYEPLSLAVHRQNTSLTLYVGFVKCVKSFALSKATV